MAPILAGPILHVQATNNAMKKLREFKYSCGTYLAPWISHIRMTVIRDSSNCLQWHFRSSTLKSLGGRTTCMPKPKLLKLPLDLSQSHHNFRLVSFARSMWRRSLRSLETMSKSGSPQMRWKPPSHRQTCLSCQLKFGRRSSTIRGTRVMIDALSWPAL